MKWSIFHTDIPTQKRQEFYNDLQICYYVGDKLKDDDIPKNCINVPFDKVYDFFKETRLRYPEVIDFKNISLNDEEKQNIVSLFQQALSNANGYKSQKANEYIQAIKNNKLNFKEPLRFFLMANRHTSVMQYVSKSIVESLNNLGYKTKFLIEKNPMEMLHSVFYYESLSEFNPHVIININHLNNEHLNDDIFNVVWFQDYMPVLQSDNLIFLRDRDVIFSYYQLFDKRLRANGVTRPIYRQYFCAEKNKFYNQKLKRKKRVVFVGGKYNIQERHPFINEEMEEKFYKILSKGKEVTVDVILKQLQKYNIKIDTEKYDIGDIQQGVVRNYAVTTLYHLDYPKEIYGNRWQEYLDDKIVCKGILEHQKIPNLYNSSRYVLLASGPLINTQRLAETLLCGAIPIIYDSRNICDERETWNEYVLYFKTQKDLESILHENRKPKKRLSQSIVEETFSYDSLVNKVVNIIDNKLMNKRY